jgi:hypothetical protein
MPKRKLEDNVAEQAMEGLVARVTRGVLEALAKQGEGKRSVPKFKRGEGKHHSVPKSKRPDTRCWRCCKKGHKARECKGEVTCYRCGGRGHIAQMCATPAPEEAGDLRDRLDEIRAREEAKRGNREDGESSRPHTVSTSSSSSSSSSSSESSSQAIRPIDVVRAPLATGEDLDEQMN